MRWASWVSWGIRRTDADWAELGQDTPYYGVLGADDFESASEDDDVAERFFATGARDVERVRGLIRSELNPSFEPTRAIDFGCGVGRITVPLSEWSSYTVGVDTSSGMLRAAAAHTMTRPHGGLDFVRTDDVLPFRPNTFDFVHSYIVLQHIHPRRGVAILNELVALLAAGGIGCVHVTYADRLDRATRARVRLYRALPVLWTAKNAVFRRPDRPMIQMYEYDLNQVFDVLHRGGCHRICVRFTEHGHHRGVVVLFEKSTELFGE